MSDLQRGDEVYDIQNPSRRGTVIDGPRYVSGAAHYRVRWDERRRPWKLGDYMREYP